MAVVVWCRIGMRNNKAHRFPDRSYVVVWCRIGMRNNDKQEREWLSRVVVWCRIGMRNNRPVHIRAYVELWFDVELEWETTFYNKVIARRLLWFDVELEWETTIPFFSVCVYLLWFDVELEWETTAALLALGIQLLWFDVELEWGTTTGIRLFLGRIDRPGVPGCHGGTVEAAVCHCCSGWREHVACGRKMCAGYLCTRCIGIYRYLRILRIIN